MIQRLFSANFSSTKDFDDSVFCWIFSKLNIFEFKTLFKRYVNSQEFHLAVQTFYFFEAKIADWYELLQKMDLNER